MSGSSLCWAVVPAAGVGRRMGQRIPKQYLPLLGRPVIDHTLERLIRHPAVAEVCVALAADDPFWARTAYAEHPRIIRAPGGVERCHSVLNALVALEERAEEGDWVLVHDAARPCVRPGDLSRLLARLDGHPVGGLLGVPVRDTMKRTDESNLVLETVPREGLWHAFTPQVFRYGALREALEVALAFGGAVTDEAAAIELSGRWPLLVEGHADNIKITRAEDLALAAFYLERQAGEER
jgi:2-C-methyl-D-erythritol 4-phosphate cytidylyltransferase